MGFSRKVLKCFYCDEGASDSEQYVTLDQRSAQVLADAQALIEAPRLIDYEKQLFGLISEEFFYGSCTYPEGEIARYLYLLEHYIGELKQLQEQIASWGSDLTQQQEELKITTLFTIENLLAQYQTRKNQLPPAEALQRPVTEYEKKVQDPRKTMVFRQQGPENILKKQRFEDLPQEDPLSLGHSQKS